MKESVAIAKEADTKKGFSATKSDKSVHRVQTEPERQLDSLRGVIGNIRRDGGTPSVGSIATELSGIASAQRASVLLALQQTHGNRYVQRVVAGIQAKLKVGQSGDKYEQEADRVADAVMRMPEPGVQRQVEEEEEEELIQTEPLAEQITPLIQRQVAEGTPELESGIHARKGGGQPLPESVRTYFEPRFGRDFSRVRIHRNPEAAQMARALNAKAFTTGWDIIFGAGQYALQTVVGKKLLAHELTHVVQQDRPQETDQRHVHRQSEEEEEALQIKAEAALVQRQAEEEEPIQTTLEGVRVQRQLSSEQPAKGWSLRTAVVTVSWSKDFDTLYRRLIAALATKPAFAGLPKKSLWVFGQAVDAFRLITCGEMCAQFKEGDEVRLIARAWADPTNQELADNALIGMGRVKVGLGSVIEEEESKHVAAGPEESKKAQSGAQEEKEEVETRKEVEELEEVGISVTPEKIKNVMERMDDSLGKLDTLLKQLEWAASVAEDNEALKLIKRVRDHIDRYGGPLSKSLKIEKTITKGLNLCVAIDKAAKYEPGSKEALLALTGIGHEAGALLKDLAGYVPPGLSHLLEAIGEAAEMLPDAVRSWKEIGESRRPEEILRRQNKRLREIERRAKQTQ